MKKKILSVLMASAMTMTMLAGLGISASAEEAKSIEPTTVTFWHAMSGTQQETLESLTQKFNEENEYGITVELEYQGSYSDLSKKLTANAAAGTLPDLTQAYNNVLLEYLDFIVPLDDYVANDFDNWEDIIENYRDECSEFGYIHALPFNKSTYVFFYNKTLFDENGLEAPKTWDDLVTIGETLKENAGIAAIGYDDMAGMLETYLRQAGVDYVSEEGALFDTDEGQEVVNFIMDLYNNGYARLVGEDGYFSTVLSNGLVGGYVGSSTGATYITADGWELGVAPLVSGTNAAAYAAGTNIVMFSSDENQQAATWEYMKFLTSTESTLTWAMSTGYLPIRTSAYESDEYQEFMAGDITATAAYAQAENFFHSATFDGSNEIRNEVNTALETIINAGDDGETAMSELVSTINKVVD